MFRTIDEFGRITIPAEMRDKLDISPKGEVKLECENGKIIITNVKKEVEIAGLKRDIVSMALLKNSSKEKANMTKEIFDKIDSLF